MKCRQPELPLGLRPDEQHPVLTVDEPLLDQVARDRQRRPPSAQAAAATRATASPPPGLPAGRGRAAAGRRCAAARAAPPPRSTNPRPQASSSPAAQQEAHPRRARGTGSSAPFPRADRCARAAAGTRRPCSGEFTWMTRSRSPTSMPSSSADVDDDHAVPALGERLLRAAPLVQRQRRVHQVCGHAARPQLRAEHLDEPLGVARTPAASRPGAAPRSPSPRSRRTPRSQAQVQRRFRFVVGPNGPGRVPAAATMAVLLPAGALQPASAARPGSPRSPTGRSAASGLAGDQGQPLEHGEQMPAPVARRRTRAPRRR